MKPEEDHPVVWFLSISVVLALVIVVLVIIGASRYRAPLSTQKMYSVR